MSLNMYLGSIPKVDGYSFQELINYEEMVHDDLGVLPEDLKHIAYKKGITNWYSLTTDIGIWSNTFSIHDWFIEKITNGEANGLPYKVSAEELIELKDLVKEVLFDNANTGTHRVAEEKMSPHQEFYLTRMTYYKEFYKELKRTLYILEEALKVDFDNNYVYYQAN